MKVQRNPLYEIGRARRRRGATGGMSALLSLLAVIFISSKAVSIEVPPEVEKRAVALTMTNADAERTFLAACGKCHKHPDPASSGPLKDDCTNSVPQVDLRKVQDYFSNVRTGRDLYNSNCDRCHTLIDPQSHTFEYWSRNICTSDSCMVKRRLTSGEEQQLLLYLSSHAKRDHIEK